MVDQEVLRWIFGFGGLVSGIIVSYRFLFERPSLKVTLNSRQQLVYKDAIQCQFEFRVENTGKKYAEGTYIELYFPEWKLQDNEDKNLRVQFSSPDQEKWSPLETRTNVSNSTIAPDLEQESTEIFIDDVIHRESSYQIYSGVRTFHSNECHRVKYSVVCQGHKKRKGVINITPDMENGEFSIVHNHSTRRKRICSQLSKCAGHLYNLLCR